MELDALTASLRFCSESQTLAINIYYSPPILFRVSDTRDLS
uniref:Uncharacterized protein n=1 Tax=Arundo donax TaxID=35708 RepID=A0A0A9FYZ2_ARUDO